MISGGDRSWVLACGIQSLSAEGFYLELSDSAGNIVDTVGNFDG